MSVTAIAIKKLRHLVHSAVPFAPVTASGSVSLPFVWVGDMQDELRRRSFCLPTCVNALGRHVLVGIALSEASVPRIEEFHL